jgi:hypothetical protein
VSGPAGPWRLDVAQANEYMREISDLLRLAADMLEPDTAWSADEVTAVRNRLRKLARHAPTLVDDDPT